MPSTPRDFLKTLPKVALHHRQCPKCGSHNICNSAVEDDGTYQYGDGFCYKCGGEWRSAYLYRGVVNRPTLDPEPWLSCPFCHQDVHRLKTTDFANDHVETAVDCDCGKHYTIWHDFEKVLKINEASDDPSVRVQAIALADMLLEVRRGPDIKALKTHRRPLTPEERSEVIQAGAVWDDGSPGVWKAVVNGRPWYVCSTHRAGQVKPTLKGAISSFKFIKTTS